VADDKRDSPRPFDVRTVEYLLRLMAEHELGEIDLREGDQRIRLRKGAGLPFAFDPPPTVPAAGLAPPGPLAAAAPAPTAAAPAPTPGKLHEIKSELIGTFYTRPKPDKDDFVKVGSRVTPDTTVCLIEAMKIYNEIKAGVSGVIREVCVKNQDFVEFGTVLFRVEPS
jgi:acetyl-CoA carboxylase biotin carboxyl carrier protein